MAKLALIRIRGLCKVKSTISDTLDMFGLSKKHSCVVLEDSPSVKGMIKKIENYVTWGEISDEALKLLEEKRSKTSKKNDFKTVYFLAPPRKGFERGGIKKPFTTGGALGYRAEKINDLIVRMI